MTTTTDPHAGPRLAAAGQPLTLTDGRTVQLRYTMRSLLHLERTFGGLTQMQTALGGTDTGAAIEPVLQLLTAGLLHEHDGTGAPLTVDKLADLLAPAQLEHATTLATNAMAEAFPPPPQAPQAGAAQTTSSHGTTGTTPAPSPSAAPTAPSGS